MLLAPSGFLVVVAVIAQLAFVAAPVVGIYLLWRFLRAYERRNHAHRDMEALKERLSQIEETIAGLGAGQDRLVEEQRFLTRLLGERKDAPSS